VQPNSTNPSASDAVRHMLGYLNLSEGRPDARFQKLVNEFYRDAHGPEPWRELRQALQDGLRAIRGTSPAFQDTTQADAAITLLFEQLLPAYRAHHSELLFHLSDDDLHQPFFVARAFEALLAEGGPWGESDRITRGSLQRLNDFVGYRPVAVLERKRCEPYDHERVRPIPLYIRDTGVAVGRYHDLVARTLEILQGVDPAILDDAQFRLERLDELAVDPRPYDFSHPVHQRPNYLFGEWDPHCIDNAGNYRRFVLRQVTLDALLDRVRTADSTQAAGDPQAERGAGAQGDADGNARLFESAAVLGGTMLMAAANSGAGPDAHDSSVTLATLVPKIARLRDRYYEQLLSTLSGSLGDRLREEAARMRQPFASVRQYLNQNLARRRASQLQHSRLAAIYTEMGFSDAGRDEARRVATASERITTELNCRFVTGHALLDRDDVAAAAAECDAAESLLHRGIACGAIVDPWNILGFQGQFSIFPAIENSVPDPRVDQLAALVERILALRGRLLANAAAAGEEAIELKELRRYQEFVAWWDQFASVSVAGVRHVHGQSSLEAATHVAHAMAAWRRAGEAAGNVRFWREHAIGFHSPRAFAHVIETLIERRDFVASMALLMSWLGQADSVALENPPHSFSELAVRWLVGTLGILDSRSDQTDPANRQLVIKFFDYLEANAEDYWLVPNIELGKNQEADELSGPPNADDDEDGGENIYSAAYDGVTFRDSAQDGNVGETLEGGPAQPDFELDSVRERIAPRLQFLETLAILWRIAATVWTDRGDSTADAAQRDSVGGLAPLPSPDEGRGWPIGQEGGANPETRHREYQPSGADGDRLAAMQSWLDHLRGNQAGLARLVAQIERIAIPQPLGSHDSLVEYDRRRTVRGHLIEAVIAAQLESSNTARKLRSASDPTEDVTIDDVESLAARAEQALRDRNSEAIHTALEPLLHALVRVPLTYQRLEKGGEARHILSVRVAQSVLLFLVRSLPRAGHLYDTYRVLEIARRMESEHATGGEQITELDHLLRAAIRATADSVLEAATRWTTSENADEPLLDCLESLTGHFMSLWLERSQRVRLSAIDRVPGDREWQELQKFIERYGHDLLTPAFLTLGNLRAILDQGVDKYLRYLEENRDPLHPNRLVEELDRGIRRADAIGLLQLLMEIIVENYDEYKDYNATTAQSDYGERFYALVEFLRLKARYVRMNWNLQPVAIVHQSLVRHGRAEAARQWCEEFDQETSATADALLEELAAIEGRTGVRLASVRDLLAERFTRPLALDGIRCLIPLAYGEAKQHRLAVPNHSSSPPEAGAAFDELRRKIQDFAEQPSGVGTEVPGWLRSIEREVERLSNKYQAAIDAVERSSAGPHAQFSWQAVQQQIALWPKSS
jgi:hypothetical protein